MNWRRIYTSFYYIWMSIQHIVSAKSTEKKQKQLYHSVKMVPALKSTIENCKKLFPQKKKNQFPVKISCHMVMNNKLLLKSSKDHIKKSHPKLPACRRLLFPLLHAEKGRLRNAVANRVPASRWQGILFRINCEIISG